jgi:hypothetical protein
MADWAINEITTGTVQEVSIAEAAEITPCKLSVGDCLHSDLHANEPCICQSSVESHSVDGAHLWRDLVLIMG